jgi:hypothetical protein
MMDWQFDVCCPLCGRTFRGNRFLRHHKRDHGDLSESTFLSHFRTSLAEGKTVLGTKRVIQNGTEPYGHTIFNCATRLTSKGVTVFRGGAIGMGGRK